jgi:hypothetical protein
MNLRRETSKICVGLLSLRRSYSRSFALVNSSRTLRSIPKRSLRCPVARRRTNATQTTKDRRGWVSIVSPTRGTLEISLFVFVHIANTKYKIVTAGLSVYDLAQAPRLHFSLHGLRMVWQFVIFISCSFPFMNFIIFAAGGGSFCIYDLTQAPSFALYYVCVYIYIYLFIPMIGRDRVHHLLFVYFRGWKAFHLLGSKIAAIRKRRTEGLAAPTRKPSFRVAKWYLLKDISLLVRLNVLLIFQAICNMVGIGGVRLLTDRISVKSQILLVCLFVNDPSAGSPTETLLRLLLPLNDQVWSSSR